MLDNGCGGGNEAKEALYLMSHDEHMRLEMVDKNILIARCDGCDDVTCLSMLCWSSSAYSRAGGGTPGGGAMYIRGE